MNVFARFDKSMVTGYLREAKSQDPEVLRTRYLGLRSRMELFRKLLLVPLGIGCLQIAVGLIGLIIIVGVFLIVTGVFFAGISWWARNRLRQNLVVAETAFRDYPALQNQPAEEPM